jgi:ribulose kinase
MLGIGVSRPGDMGIVMGSSFVHLVLSKQPMFSDSIWGPYNNAVIPGLYCLEGGQVSAGSIANWFIREFKVEGEDPFDLMMDEASAIPPGSKGVIALDYFQGNRTPYKDPLAKGVFYGLTLSHTRAHMYRSILEGVAYGMRNVIESMSADKLHINSIMACGGVTRNPLWLKIIADVCGKPINLTTQSSYAGILGCCIVAAVGSGAYNQFEEATVNMVVNKSVVQPDMQAHQTYHQLYEDYTTLYQQLAGLMHKNEKWYHNRF